MTREAGPQRRSGVEKADTAGCSPVGTHPLGSPMPGTPAMPQPTAGYLERKRAAAPRIAALDSGAPVDVLQMASEPHTPVLYNFVPAPCGWTSVCVDGLTLLNLVWTTRVQVLSHAADGG